MINVMISYDVYSGLLKFYVDGRILPGISQFSRFQYRPFSEWCPQIFRTAYEEINDDYTMTYVGRSCEARMLAHYSKEDSHCRCFSIKQLQLSDSALKRLKKLHMLCMNGLIYKKRREEIIVFTDFPEAEIQELFKQALPKLCYCSWKICCIPPEQWTGQEPAFFTVVSENKKDIAEEIVRKSRLENYMIRIADKTQFVKIKNHTYINEARWEDLASLVQEILEFGRFPEVLKNVMNGIQMKDTAHPQYYNFWSLDKVEPCTIPVFPKSMEYGESKNIEFQTIPEGAEPAPLEFRISSEEILKIQGNVMTAVGSGNVVIESYLLGQPVRIASTSMKVVRRNRITKLGLLPDILKMNVGDAEQLRCVCKPKDADNISTIRFQSVDGTVAAVWKSGKVEARKPGQTIIFAETDNHVKGTCAVTVYPRLEKIQVSIQKKSIRCGEYCQVETVRIPEEAVLDPLIFSIDPCDVAEYDAGAKIIITKKTGKAVLHVTDSRNSVETEITFTVKRKGLFH